MQQPLAKRVAIALKITSVRGDHNIQYPVVDQSLEFILLEALRRFQENNKNPSFTAADKLKTALHGTGLLDEVLENPASAGKGITALLDAAKIDYDEVGFYTSARQPHVTSTHVALGVLGGILAGAAAAHMIDRVVLTEPPAKTVMAEHLYFKNVLIENGQFHERLTLELKREKPGMLKVTWHLQAQNKETTYSYILTSADIRANPQMKLQPFSGTQDGSFPIGWRYNSANADRDYLRDTPLPIIAYDLSSAFIRAYTASVLQPLSQIHDPDGVLDQLKEFGLKSRKDMEQERSKALEEGNPLYKQLGLDASELLYDTKSGTHFDKTAAKALNERLTEWVQLRENPRRK